MSMRAVWVDEGSDPDWSRLGPFTHVSLSCRDSRTAANIAAVRAHGKQPVIHAGHGWFQGSPAEVAATLDRLWLDYGGADKWLPIQVDFEQHDPAWIAEFFRIWRLPSMRPGLTTSFTFEGFQGGDPRWPSWLATIRQPLIDANVQLVPQAYGGSPPVRYSARGVVEDLVQAGFPRERIVPFLLASDLPRGWELGGAWVFTQAGLP